MHRRLLALAILGAFVASAAVAQDRPPPERRTLLDLAYALGESHALRQVCSGDGDQFWRDRMVRVTDTEAAEAAFNSRMTQQFNAGFATRQSQFRGCGPASKRAEQAVARKGRALAGRLGSISRAIRDTGPVSQDAFGSDSGDPDFMADTLAPR